MAAKRGGYVTIKHLPKVLGRTILIGMTTTIPAPLWQLVLTGVLAFCTLCAIARAVPA